MSQHDPGRDQGMSRSHAYIQQYRLTRAACTIACMDTRRAAAGTLMCTCCHSEIAAQPLQMLLKITGEFLKLRGVSDTVSTTPRVRRHCLLLVPGISPGQDADMAADIPQHTTARSRLLLYVCRRHKRRTAPLLEFLSGVSTGRIRKEFFDLVSRVTSGRRGMPAATDTKTYFNTPTATMHVDILTHAWPPCIWLPPRWQSQRIQTSIAINDQGLHHADD